jgi:hypothetical protein
MSFDATKLIPGKKYRTRSGGSAEYVTQFTGMFQDGRLLWLMLFDDGTKSSFETTVKGFRNPAEGKTSSDIISDDPIREPVKVTNHRRICNVYPSGMVYAYKSREDADIAATSDRIGVYELPAEIEVTPIQ